MLILEERGNWHCSIGRLTVVYLRDRGVIRLVHSVTGEVIREDETEPLTRGGFRLVLEKYKKMCKV